MKAHITCKKFIHKSSTRKKIVAFSCTVIILIIAFFVMQINGIKITDLKKIFAFASNSAFTINVIPHTEGYGSTTVSWSDYYNSHKQYAFKVYKKKTNESNSKFQTVGLDYKQISNIKVLQVYPTSSASNQIKSWMEADAGNGEKIGKGKISVSSVYIDYFNSSPQSYLYKITENGVTKWNYNVIVFGTWDSNNGKDLSTKARDYVETFINSGGGAIFGHDTVRGGGQPVFRTLSSYVGVKVHDSVYMDIPSAEKIQVEIIKSGIFTNYPWYIGDVGTTLTIPTAHTIGQEANPGTSWLRFYTSTGSYDSTTTYPSYLTTYNNCALIMTGHSSGAATTDEQKIWANLIFYVNQLILGIDHVDDASAQDEAKPNTPNIEIDTSTYSSFKVSSTDQGTSYDYKVESYYSNDTTSSGLVDTSETKSATVTTGIKKYIYKFDSNASTTLTKESDGTVITDLTTNGSSSETTIPCENSAYLHVVAVDGAGNVSETKTYEVPQKKKLVVKYYLKNLDGSTYSLSNKSFEREYPVMSTIDAPLEHFEGFTAEDQPQKVLMDLKDEHIVEYHYKRNKHTFTMKKITDVNLVNGVDTSSSSQSGKEYYYGAPILLNATVADGYTWVKWEQQYKSITGDVQDKIVSLPSEQSGGYALMPDSDLTIVPVIELTQYKITYELDGGTFENRNDTYTIVSNFKLSEHGNPTRAGCTFLGWVENDGDTPDPNLSITPGQKGDKTFYAKWSLISYTIRCDLDGGTLENNTSAWTIDNGFIKREYNVETETFGLDTPSKENYEFKGWIDDTDGTVYDNVIIAKGTIGDKQYTAKWELSGKIRYTVIHYVENLYPGYSQSEIPQDHDHYSIMQSQDGYVDKAPTSIHLKNNDYTGFTTPENTDELKRVTEDPKKNIFEYYYKRNQHTFSIQSVEGVSTAGSTDTSIEPYYEQEITLKATVQQGYVWEGWENVSTTDAGKAVKLPENMEGTFEMPDGDVIVKPKVSPITYNITYLNVPEDYTNNENVKTTYTAKDKDYDLIYPEKEGYTFKGWTGSNGTTIDPDVTIKQNSSGDKSYYANWELTEYTVTCHIDDEEDSIDYNMESDTFSIENPTKEGYTFAGWKDLKNANNEKIQTITITHGSTGDKEYEATWNPNTDTKYYVYHCKQKIYGDSSIKDEENYDYGDPEELTGTTGETVTPKTKTFTGFTYESCANSQGTDKSLVINADGSSTIYYYYVRNQHQFTMNQIDEVTIEDDNTPNGMYNYETTINLNVKPITGYEWVGWKNVDTTSTDPTSSNNLVSSSENYYFRMPDNDVTVTPVVQTAKYSITYNLNVNDGESVGNFNNQNPKESYTITDEDYELPKDLTREHYTFDGWSEKSDENQTPKKSYVIAKGTTGNKIFDAHWTPDTYTITYNLDGGTTTEDLPSTYNIETPTFTIKNPTRVGYRFTGWTDLDNPNSERIQTLTIEKGTTGNKNYKANWEASPDSVYYVYYCKQKLNGDPNVHDESNYDYLEVKNTGATDEIVTPEVKNYDGFTSPNAQQLKIAGDGSSKLYYYYTRNKYQFTISPTTGAITQGSSSNGKYNYESIITIKGDALPGYKWIGWKEVVINTAKANKMNINNFNTTNLNSFMDNTNSGTKIAEETNLSMLGAESQSNEIDINNSNQDGLLSTEKSGTFVMPYKDVTLMPVVEEIPYKITYNKNGGEFSETPKETYTTSEEFYLPKPTKEGYIFTGWTDTNGNSNQKPQENYKIEKGTTGDKTFDAHYELTPYTITCYIDEGNTKEIKYNKEQETFTIQDPTKEGYTFTGWTDLDNNKTIQTITIPKGTTGDKKYKANWIPGTHTKYLVYYCKQKINKDPNVKDETNYDYGEPEVKYGTTGETVTPEVKTFEGFTYSSYINEQGNTQSIVINADGSSKIYYYYTRNKYELKLETSEGIDSVTGQGTYYYGEDVNINANVNSDYVWKEWTGDNTIKNQNATITIGAKNATYQATALKKSKIIIKYIDITTNQKIIDDEIVEVYEKVQYEIKRKDIENYSLVKCEGQEKGTMTREPVEVTYYYKHVAGGVVEEDIDINSKEVIYSKKYQGTVDEEYKIEPREIEGYKLYTEDENKKSYLPDNAEGKMTEDEIKVKYYYIKLAEMNVKYIDANTNEEIIKGKIISGVEGDKYETEEKEFDGYKLVEKPENTSGKMKGGKQEIKYLYKRKMRLIVKYLDMEGKEISKSDVVETTEGEKYSVGVKEIKGYEIVNIPKDTSGVLKFENGESDKVLIFTYQLKQEENTSEEPEVNPSENTTTNPKTNSITTPIVKPTNNITETPSQNSTIKNNTIKQQSTSSQNSSSTPKVISITSKQEDNKATNSVPKTGENEIKIVMLLVANIVIAIISYILQKNQKK